MKVLLLNGSPRSSGCVYVALREVANALNENGIETEIMQVGSGAVRGCIACGACETMGKCVYDDVVNEVAAKFRTADGLVVGSPVYYGSANGTVVSLLDRLFYSTTFDKRMKVGACVVSCRRGGNTATFDQLNKYFSISNMPIATSSYWNQIHGSTAAEAMEDKEGLYTMRNLGNNMAFLIKAIALAKEQYGLPDPGTPARTDFFKPQCETCSEEPANDDVFVER